MNEYSSQILNGSGTHTQFVETGIGKFPSDWTIKSIGEVCEILDSKRIPLNDESRRKIKGYIPYYGANGLVDFINAHIFDDKLILIAEDGGYFEEYITRSIAYLVEGKCYAQDNIEAPVLIPLGGEWAFSVSFVENKYGGRQVRVGKGKIIGGYYRDRKTNEMILRPDDPMKPITLPNKLNVKRLEDWNKLQQHVVARLQALEKSQ